MADKHRYEKVAKSYGLKVKVYHADNLRLNDANYKENYIKIDQRLSFYGAGAHHQHYITDNMTKQICHGGCTSLLRAKIKWPELISTILWSYTIDAVVHRHNKLSLDNNGRSPLESYLRTDDEIIQTDFHTCGYHIYSLDASNPYVFIRTPK